MLSKKKGSRKRIEHPIQTGAGANNHGTKPRCVLINRRTETTCLDIYVRQWPFALAKIQSSGKRILFCKARTLLSPPEMTCGKVLLSSYRLAMQRSDEPHLAHGCFHCDCWCYDSPKFQEDGDHRYLPKSVAHVRIPTAGGIESTPSIGQIKCLSECRPSFEGPRLKPRAPEPEGNWSRDQAMAVQMAGMDTKAARLRGDMAVVLSLNRLGIDPVLVGR